MKKGTESAFQRIVNLYTGKIITLPIKSLLYSIAILSITNIALTAISNSIIDDSLLQTKIADHVLFELEYGNERTMRHVDITMRGFAIIPDEKYLYRSHEFILIDQENNFKRLDSLLRLQGYDNKEGLSYLEQYKVDLRRFVDYHGKMISFLKHGERAKFEEEFKKDIGANFWPHFSKALSTISEFEYDITENANNKYKFFSSLIIYFQFFSFVFTCFVLVLVFRRIMINRSIDKFIEKQKMTEELNRVKENMLSLMSHEIRTPLNSMIGLTHVLGKRDPRPDQKEIIHTLEASGDHLIHIVNDILDYNKIQANRLGLELSPFNLSDILRQIHSMFFRMADEKNISFLVQVDSGMPLNLIGDSTRLIQIINNLVGNAMKFTSTGGVYLRVRPIQIVDGWVTTEFVVTDTGIGISPDKIDAIFQPFSQDKDIHRKFGGTGLGLVIVKNLVELMEGKVTVSSTYEKGSTFTVTIPFEITESNSVDEISPENVKNAENVLNGRKILYVEDVESNRFLINSLLEDYAVECHNVENATEALASIREVKFDLILLDIQLPDMNGFHVAQSIRTGRETKNMETPIILFSAFTNIRESDVKNCGANDFINKPFKPEELIYKMQKAIRRNS